MLPELMPSNVGLPLLFLVRLCIIIACAVPIAGIVRIEWDGMDHIIWPIVVFLHDDMSLPNLTELSPFLSLPPS
jgi:hypothetical protein